MKRTKRILVAPLCWGLGHAARCIPVVTRLLQLGAQVVLASDGEALELLRAEFPDLPFAELPPYRVRYASNSMIWSIAPQLPHLFSVLKKERKALDSIIQNHKIDALISDNRYGLHHPDIPCVLLSHQMNIKMPYLWLQWLFAKLNHSYWRKYDYCWIPDFEHEPSLAGELSHGQVQGANIRYIGSLSRMQPAPRPEKKYDLLAVLSGPEPQRSRWETQIVAQAKRLPLKVGIIQGKTQLYEYQQITENIDVFSYLTSSQLNTLMLSSDIILARSGYSTLMDLAQLGCPKAILVPTPGQTEQEYLAQRFMQTGCFFSQPASAFNLKQALAQIPSYTGLQQLTQPQLLDNAIAELLGRL